MKRQITPLNKLENPQEKNMEEAIYAKNYLLVDGSTLIWWSIFAMALHEMCPQGPTKGRSSLQEVFYKFHKIHRKTPVSETLF